jgi:hypothetical protein
MKASNKIHQSNLNAWNEHFKAQASSGLTVKEYCKLNNLSHHAYYYWKRIAKEEYIDSILPDIVQVQPSLAQSTNNSMIPHVESYNLSNLYNLSNSRNLYDSRNTLQISLGDIHIDIGSNAPDELILSIIKAVRHA